MGFSGNGDAIFTPVLDGFGGGLGAFFYFFWICAGDDDVYAHEGVWVGRGLGVVGRKMDVVGEFVG